MNSRQWTLYIRICKCPIRASWARFEVSWVWKLSKSQFRVRVGAIFGVGAAHVAGALAEFERKLRSLVEELDSLLPASREQDADQLAAIVDLCAWVHSEWVRIHPFANGSGRAARLWANSIVMRYRLPPFLRLRPRPDSSYAEAGAKAMQGDWKPTAIVFRKLLDDFPGEA